MGKAEELEIIYQSSLCRVNENSSCNSHELGLISNKNLLEDIMKKMSHL